MLSQSSEIAVTCTLYCSPHLSMVTWQLSEADVQLSDAPVPSTAVARYKLAPKTESHVTVTIRLEQLYTTATDVTGFMAKRDERNPF